MTIRNKWVTYQPLTCHSNQVHAYTNVNLIWKYQQSDLQARIAKILTNNLDKQDNRQYEVIKSPKTSNGANLIKFVVG